MLDDVERRRFLEQPAREDPLPAPVGKLDVELYERARQGFALPRSGRLARAQPHHDVLDPHRLARPQRNVADDAVALVEQAQDCHPLSHGRDASLVACRRPRLRNRPLALRLPLGLAIAVAARGTKPQRDEENGRSAHAQSGVQGR
jgi:hypothetical protein